MKLEQIQDLEMELAERFLFGVPIRDSERLQQVLTGAGQPGGDHERIEIGVDLRQLHCTTLNEKIGARLRRWRPSRQKSSPLLDQMLAAASGAAVLSDI